MTLVKNYLFFIFFTLSANIVSANTIPENIASTCGKQTCDQIFKKMKKFAKNGSPHAQAVLSLLYRGGYGTEIDNELSVRYIKRAAKSNLAFAQYNLAVLYLNGHLVEKDEKEADRWLKRAAGAGYSKAKKLLLSENKISQEEGMSYEKDRRMPDIKEGEKLVLITKSKYTLSDLADYLSSLGYGRKNKTGSHIRGKGCGDGGSHCLSWKINSPLGRANFDSMIYRVTGQQTAILVNSRPQ